MDTINPASICPACGTANRCAVAQGDDAKLCWCTRAALAPLPTDAAVSCYCNACLQKLMTERPIDAAEPLP